MNNKTLLNLFGLKWNPFSPNIPAEALWRPPAIDSFFFRIENLVKEGGFALICGEPGLGKSKNLQLLVNRLAPMGDVIVAVMERPQSSLTDFYREMGDLFEINLSPANRYGGFKSLRIRWHEHFKNTLLKPVLLVDEAQEMATPCLNELRLLGSANFDSECLLTTILCGDNRLPERFRALPLVSLGSRIQVRRQLEPYTKNDLLDYLRHAVESAGAPALMTKELMQTLAEHAGGYLRVLNSMSNDLLVEGAQREIAQLDEKLFLELYARTPNRKN
ncbi:ExeA family protein [Desulfosarcina ovata]|uniref:AAA+ ATPase domain-containing protein n=1 Tax=Desulfosarcina ovata subsp. ovata TaxID=2752305 RepID=A0A5K8A539_9BACT|nr:ATP-binding protein [Desulfosarcina ovata]BBO87611.1 hypothetical protein DSCOOX_07910 [Desulfosarcina ovata subsp. ovata]